MADEFKKVRAESEVQGWRWEQRRNGHWMGFAPGGQGIVTFAGTPSDHRALANTIAKMRRLGFKWRGR